MSGNKITRLLIVLVVLVGVFLIVKFTGNSGRSESFRSTLVELDTAKVTKVEILSPSDTTVLTKSEGKWTVNKEYLADANTVKGMLANLQRIEPSRIASRSEDSWKDFQVDETGTRVVVYESGDKTLDIILGRFNVEGQRSYYSYVRLSEDPDVYVAKDFMKMSISEGSEAYRNDDVLRLQKDSIQSVAFNYPDSAFVLEQGPSGWETGGMVADSASVVNYLQGLRFLNSRKFAKSTSSSVAYDVSYSLSNGSTVEVTTFSDGVFTSSQNSAEAWDDTTTKDKIFKSQSYFLTEE